jgi:hypothetical protein
MTSFENIILSAQKAAAQFSVTQGKQSENEEVVREFAIEAMKAIAGLVFEAGGDPDYVETWVDGIANDIELSFQSAREPVVTPVFRPRRGLGLTLVEGARL